MSVVIPAYKSEATIGDALKSLLGDIECGLEVVVVVDGQLDRTSEILASFPLIKVVVNQINVGASRSRNIGLAHVSDARPYVMFLDSDDYVADDLIAGLAGQLQASDAQICFGKFAHAYFSQAGHLRSIDRVLIPHEASPDVWAKRFVSGQFVPPCAVMWNKEFLYAIGAWDEDLPKYQDGELAIRAMAAWPKIAYGAVGRGLYCHRCNEERVSNSVSSTMDGHWGIVSALLAFRDLCVDDDSAKFVLHSAAARFCYDAAVQAYVSENYGAGRDFERLARAMGLKGHFGKRPYRYLNALIGLKRRGMLQRIFSN